MLFLCKLKFFSMLDLSEKLDTLVEDKNGVTTLSISDTQHKRLLFLHVRLSINDTQHKGLICETQHK
jgi:hypothetical protein